MKPVSRSKGARLFAIALACLVLLEGAGRLLGFGQAPQVHLDPLTEYHLVASRTYTRFGNSIEVNRYGMRSDDFDRATVASQDLISVFGDSVVYGNHQITQTQTVAHQLQQLAAEPPGRSKTIVNAIAASSWGPENLLGYLDKFGDFPARTGILVISSHDVVDVPWSGDDLIPYRASPTYGAVHDIALTLIEYAKRLVPKKPPPGPSYEQKLARTAAAIDRLVERLKAHHDEVLLVYHPTTHELAAAQRPASEQDFAGIASRHGIRFLSMVDAYRAARAEGIDVYEDSIHLAPGGTSLLAKRLFEHLAAKRD